MKETGIFKHGQTLFSESKIPSTGAELNGKLLSFENMKLTNSKEKRPPDEVQAEEICVLCHYVSFLWLEIFAFSISHLF